MPYRRNCRIDHVGSASPVVIKSLNDLFLSAMLAKFPWVRPSATTRNVMHTREHLPNALANITSRGGIVCRRCRVVDDNEETRWKIGYHHVLHPRFLGRDLRRRGHFDRHIIAQRYRCGGRRRRRRSHRLCSRRLRRTAIAIIGDAGRK